MDLFDYFPLCALVENQVFRNFLQPSRIQAKPGVSRVRFLIRFFKMQGLAS